MICLPCRNLNALVLALLIHRENLSKPGKKSLQKLNENVEFP